MNLQERVQQLEEEMSILRAAVTALTRTGQRPTSAPEVTQPKQAWKEHVDLVLTLANLVEQHKRSQGLVEEPPALVLQAQFTNRVKTLQITEQIDLRGQVEATTLARLAAVLASEPRISILKTLLTEDQSAAELSKASSLEGGPLYHHLSDLQEAGLVRQKGRGRYVLTEAGQDVFYHMAALVSRWQRRLPSPPEEESPG